MKKGTGMDWTEQQFPPPRWQDEGDPVLDLEDDQFCPLTSVVRKCYLNYLKQTLLQNYNSCRTQTISQSTLQDLILSWEQDALRSCMVSTIYQKAMRHLVNTIKADTKQQKLTSVLKATIKRSQRQHLVDVSTQTESSPLTSKLTVKQPTVNGYETKKVKREHPDTHEGPFLTPPSDYPLPTQKTKKVSREQLPYPPKENHFSEAKASFDALPHQVPFQCQIPPPDYPFATQQLYHGQFTDWSANNGYGEFHAQPITVITNACAEPQYDATGNSSFVQVPELQDSNQTQLVEPMLEERPYEDVHTDEEFSSCHNDTSGLSYSMDQIEERMARLYGLAFTEDGAETAEAIDEPELKPAVELMEAQTQPIAPQNEQGGNLDSEQPDFYVTKLQSRLEFIRENWSLEKQAKLKRRFLELFGAEEDEDTLSQVTAKEAVQCKQRIAPWIVKHLMPLYKEKRIASRHLFKSLAKHISDLLIQRNLYPDECDIWMGVQEFFSGGTNIKCSADFAT